EVGRRDQKWWHQPPPGGLPSHGRFAPVGFWSPENPLAQEAEPVLDLLSRQDFVADDTNDTWPGRLTFRGPRRLLSTTIGRHRGPTRAWRNRGCRFRGRGRGGPRGRRAMGGRAGRWRPASPTYPTLRGPSPPARAARSGTSRRPGRRRTLSCNSATPRGCRGPGPA